MALIKTVPVFAGRNTLAKVDVEKAFAEIVKQIGGTYYVAGVSTTQTTGQLDATNFRPDAGFMNDQKSEPYSVIPVEFLWTTCTIDGTRAVFYSSKTQLPFPDMVPLEAFVSFVSDDGAQPTTVEGELTITATTASSTATLVNAQTWSKGTTTTDPYNHTAPFTATTTETLLPNATVSVTLYWTLGSSAGAAPTKVKDVKVTLICKAKHVK